MTATEAEKTTAELGKARLRKEDERLITGQTNWTDNITLPGMLHIAFLRSPYAHARITSVDVSAARNEPGVIAAYSGADFAAEQGSLPCAWPVTPDIVIPAHPPMATDEVRYVGEAVACVVARDRYAAADALAAIEVDYEPLPPDVGGGFGSKLQVTAEEVLAVLIARKLGRPVKWTETRSEGNMTVHHGRDQWQRIRIAADRDGRIRGLDVDLLADMGAYLMLVTPGVPLLGAFMFPAIYKMDAYSFRCTGVFTTKMPTDAYRGAGRPEATFAIERIMDELAAELGMDPLELRERNWIKHEEFPFSTVCG